MDRKKRILVTHPGRQHSHQLARALHEQGALFGYWTGVPSAPPSERGPLYSFLARWSPQPTLRFPARRIRHCYVEPIVRRVMSTVCSPPQAVLWQHKAMAWFDRWCATQLLDELDAIVCYENAALHTFQAAKEGGITTILDAASFHHQWQDAVYEPVETEDAHARINARKDREIALADHVLTVSELARGSYVEAGLPPERVTSVPMGADLSAFHPDGEGAKEETEPFTFIFAGQAGRRKGADLLLAASERLDQQGIPHRVQFAGSTDDELFVEIDAPVEPLGYLSRPALAAAFRRADCLVLPSRHDSFGRVVVEAMATGLPALVSENVGARDVITEETNGWVIPADSADALAVQMQWCVRHPDEAVAMQEAAVEAAEDFTWTAYRKRVTTVIDAILEGENTTLVASNARAFS